MNNNRRKFVVGIVITLFCFNILAWLAIFQLGTNKEFKVVFFDVGQGSAIFLETPNKTQILIDGGPSAKAVEKLGQIMPFWDREINLLVSTHPDSDHLTGLVEVLKSYRVDSVASTGIVGTTKEFEEFSRQAIKEKADKVVLKRGDRITVGKNLTIEVLAPFDSFEGKQAKDTNTSSLVLKVSWGESDFLLTGDASVSVERKLISSDSVLDCEVLGVSHHGSDSATSDEFLEKVSPEIAVIQVGKGNKYNHPSQIVLERLEKYGIRVLRTDEVGDITFLADSNNYQIRTQK